MATLKEEEMQKEFAEFDDDIPSDEFEEFDEEIIRETHVVNQLAKNKEPKIEEVTDSMNILEKVRYYDNEISRGFVKGALKGVTSAGKFVTDIYGATDAKKWLENSEKWLDDFFETTSTTGDISSVIGQVATGLILTKNVGSLGLTGRTVQGAMVDGIFFDEHSDNIANLLDDYNVKSDIIDWLKTDEDDGTFEARGKNALAGAGIGVAFETIFNTFKYGKELFKKSGKKFEGTDDELAQYVVDLVKQDAEEVTKKYAKPKAEHIEKPLHKEIKMNEALKQDADNFINRLSQPDTVDLKQPLNATKIAGEDNAKTFAKATEEVEADVIKRSHAETRRLVDEELRANLDDDAWSAMDELTKTAEELTDLDVKVGKHRVIVGTLAQQLSDSIKIYQKEGGSARAVEVALNLSNLMKTSKALKDTQSTIARTMSSLRMNTQNSNMINSLEILDNIDPEYSLKLMKEAISKGDDEVVAKLMEDIIDPAKKMKDHIDNYTDGFWTKLGNVLSETVVAGMLSAPSTLAVNMIGNSLVKHQRALQDIAQFGLGFVTRNADRMRARELKLLLKSNYIQNVGDLKLVTKHMKDWAKSGFKDETFDEAVLVRYVQDQEFQHKYVSSQYIRGMDKGSKGTAMNTTINTVGKISRSPYRIIGAVDDYYKRNAFRAELIREGSRVADIRKISDEAYDEFIDKFIRANTELQVMHNNNIAPTAKFLKENSEYLGTGKGITKYADQAKEHANYMTFQKELGSGLVGKGVDLLNSNGYLRVLVPFKLTPINILKHSTETAFAPLRASLWKDIASGGIKRDIALAKMTMSATIVTSMAYLATSGNMTGTFSPDERKAMQDAGIPELSYRIGDTWYEYKQIEPFATIAGVLTDLYKVKTSLSYRFDEVAEDEVDDEIREVLADVMMSITQNITQKTYAKSLAEMVQVATGEQDLVDYSGKLLSSITPMSSLANFTGRIIDEDKYEAKSWVEKVTSKYKFTLDRKALDSFGRPIKEVKYSPLITKKFQAELGRNDFSREIARLQINHRPMPKEINVEGLKVKLTDQEYWDMRRSLDKDIKLSRTLQKVVHSKAYAKASDNQRRAMFEGVINEARRVARGMMIAKHKTRLLKNIKEQAKIKQRSFKKQTRPSYNNLIIERIE